MRERFLNWLLVKLSQVPEREEFVSRDSLRYWLRRERQARLDFKGVIE